MYETFFGLKRRPFLAVPDTESYFSVIRMEEARQSIERIVRRGEGISLVVGPSGTGKTLLLRLLRKTLEIEYTVSLIANGHLETPKAFFQQLLYELRLPFSSVEETELRLILQDFARQETTPGIVLLIDEAQFLGSDVLEEIRLLMNGDDGAVPFFRTILAGNVAFEEKLTHPKFEAFNQRIASRFYLDSLTREETFRYIAWQTSVSRTRKENLPPGLAEFINHSASVEGRRLDAPHVKGDEPIFTESARFLVYKLTEGLPRLVNQLCDASLQLAAERIVRQVDEPLVQSAWARLQQIDETSLESEASSAGATPENIESVEEIVARKKATFRLKKFDSPVEFGTLESSAPSATTETAVVARSPNEYKPPYPGDDEETDEPVGVETEAEVVLRQTVEESTELETIRLMEEIDGEILYSSDDASFPIVEKPVETAPKHRILYQIIPLKNAVPEPKIVEKPAVPEKILYDIAPLEKVSEEPVVEPERRSGPVCYPVRHRTNRKPTSSFSRKPGTVFPLALTLWTFEPGDSWIGNVSAHPRFMPTRLFLVPIEIEAEEDSASSDSVDESPIETPDIDSAAPFEETPMDQETLERYGSEVLEGRPPFVRKEPNYAYQTTDSAPERKDVFPYPDPITGTVILLNWILPGVHDFDCGTGTAYRDFAARSPREIPKMESVPENRKTNADVPDPFGISRVVRLDLGADEKTVDPIPRPMNRKTSLDESFDEIVRMGKNVVSLDAAYRPEERPAAVEISVTKIPRPVAFDGEEARLQLEAAVRRITDAAEKIEQAAETTEDAGRHVKRSAVFVETEIQAALPTYKELFVELAEFQRTISAELQSRKGSLRPTSQPPALPSESAASVPDAEPTASAESQPRPDEHRGRLLPFPRRPDFIPSEATPESEEIEPAEEERSIDVRTLFQ